MRPRRRPALSSGKSALENLAPILFFPLGLLLQPQCCSRSAAARSAAAMLGSKSLRSVQLEDSAQPSRRPSARITSRKHDSIEHAVNTIRTARPEELRRALTSASIKLPHGTLDHDSILLINQESRRQRCWWYVFIVLVLLILCGSGAAIFFWRYSARFEAPRAVMMTKRMRSDGLGHLRPFANSNASASGHGRRRLQSPISGSVEGAAFADYSVSVRIGTQYFELIVDSGSSTFAVAASAENGECSTYYTGTCDGATVSTQYGSGNWSGSACSGVAVQMAGADAGKPAFAGITTETNFFNDCNGQNAINSQGIVGMGYSGLISEKQQVAGFVPLFDSVRQASQLQNIFALQCCGWTGSTSSGTGTLTLGGYDETLFTGSLAWTPIYRELYYCVNMTSPAAPSSYAYDYNGEGEEEVNGIPDCNTIIDSGTSALVFVEPIYDTIVDSISNALSNAGGDGSCVRESDLPSLPCVKLELDGGVTLSVPPSLYFQPVPGSTCRQFLISKGSAPNIIGQAMMEAYYTVFDRGNKRVGFAPIAGCGSEQPDLTCSGHVP